MKGSGAKQPISLPLHNKSDGLFEEQKTPRLNTIGRESDPPTLSCLYGRERFLCQRVGGTRRGGGHRFRFCLFFKLNEQVTGVDVTKELKPELGV